MTADPFGPSPANSPQPVDSGSDGGAFGAGSLLSGSNIVLAVMVVAGAVGLYILRAGGTPASASAEQKLVEQQVDTALLQVKALAARRNRQGETGKSIIERFYYQAEARQIPSDELKGNPFCFAPPPGTTEVVEAAPQGPSDAEIRQEKRFRQALQDVVGLKLQSVMTGSSGRVAMVSNNLLTVGQTIHGWQVMDVSPRSVTLQWKDHQHILRMRD